MPTVCVISACVLGRCRRFWLYRRPHIERGWIPLVTGARLKAKAPMPSPGDQQRLTANRLLSALPQEEYERILPDLKAVPLQFRISLHEPGDHMRYIYFPNTGVMSMLTVMGKGPAVEIASIGNEGVADLFALLGPDSSDSRLLIQVSGTAMRMESARFREHVEQLPFLRRLLGNYACALFALVAQSAACNGTHPIVKRCARRLLMTHDRVDADEFPMTHDFLSEMLGVRRPTVSAAAAALRDAGAITYHRGTITVLDRARLEAASCECYRLIRKRFDRLAGRSDAGAPTEAPVVG
jgi:CRP-like cAMP-binding protein